MENFFETNLGLNCKFAIVDYCLLEQDLTETQKAKFSQIKNTPKVFSWLKGKAALRELLGENNNLNFFPHSKISLTHSGNYALAIQALDQKIQGIGLDFEKNRILRKKAAKFFLSQNEINWLNELPEEKISKNLLRLWTVKEALFKADLNQTKFNNYFIENPQNLIGTALKHNSKEVYNFASLELFGGYLSLAFKQV